jgi:hypothetical protein
MRMRTRRLPGILSLLLALAGLGVVVVAITMAAPASATETSWAVASVLAWVANALTAAAVVLGLVAVIGRFGRWWGVAGVVVGVLSNPWLQVTILSALD